MPRARSRGFTLIEIMVVVLIIGIATAGVVITMGRGNSDLEKESERVLALLTYTREQAEVRTREFGLLCEDTRYTFVVFDPRKNLWVPLEKDEVLRTRDLPEGLSFKLLVEARPVVLRRPPDSEDYTPQVMLYSNGDLTPFELTMFDGDGRRSVAIVSNDEGLIEAQPVEEKKS